MTYLMSNETNRPHRSFWRFIFSFILIFGLFSGFLVKDALANVDSTTNYPSTNYLDNILWYKANDYITTGNTIFTFHVKTTFEITSQYDFYYYYTDQNYYQGIGDIFPSQTYIAGNTYSSNKFPKGTVTRVSFAGGDEGIFGGVHYWNYAGIPMFWTSRISLSENPFPALTITWPANNAELVANFYVSGTFTLPAASTYQWLTLFSGQAGGNEYDNVFNQNINFATSGNMAIWVSGLSAGYYDFDIFFRSTTGDFYSAQIGGYPITNVHIVNDLPYTLPPFNNQPPIYAPEVYSPLLPAPYYLANSSYSTSTAFYTTLTKTFAPVLLSIGENLTNFSQNFTASNASSTGHQLGNSILLVRSYITNINSFFANFPVGQFLLLYLIALVVVIVLRLVKGLISLFKL